MTRVALELDTEPLTPQWFRAVHSVRFDPTSSPTERLLAASLGRLGLILQKLIVDLEHGNATISIIPEEPGITECSL